MKMKNRTLSYTKILYLVVLFAVLLIANYRIQYSTGRTLAEPAQIEVEFKEGFSGENVKVSLNDEEIFNKPLTTKEVPWGWTADRFSQEVLKSRPALKFELTDKNIKKTYQLDTTKGTLLSVSMKNNKLEFMQPNLFIDLQNGFEKNTVEVLVNGKDIFNKLITTSPMIGVAGQAYNKVTGTKATIGIRVKEKNLQKEFKLDLKQGAYIGISINPGTGEFTMEQRKTHFLYD